jgi:iron-sulfur cluster assembly protein
MAAITISEGAARHIRALAAQKGTPEGGLRLGVKGGGCSGLSYFVDWSAAPGKFDEIIEAGGGARVFVDRKSAVFLQGTTLDWQTSLMQSGFVFKNPNVKSACGCGESFTV